MFSRYVIIVVRVCMWIAFLYFIFFFVLRYVHVHITEIINEKKTQKTLIFMAPPNKNGNINIYTLPQRAV